jgi:hypothetical protein
MQRVQMRTRAIGLAWRNYTVKDVGRFDRYIEERYKRSEFGQQKRLRGQVALGRQSLYMWQATSDE